MYTFRLATLSECPLIVRQRRLMFSEMGDPDRANMPETVLLEWLETHIQGGSYIGFFALEGESVVGGAGLLLYDWLPAPDRTTQRGYICNVYIEPTHRGQGLAKQLTQQCLDYCQQRGISIVTLHASEAGRPVYDRLNFLPLPEMIWRKP